jgi:hypothetical protein
MTEFVPSGANDEPSILVLVAVASAAVENGPLHES